MSLEIERKFVIAPMDPTTAPLADGRASTITQTYLATSDGSEERVRARTRDGITEHTHTIKRAIAHGIREETETTITPAAYTALIERADPDRVTVEKTRWEITHDGHTWEIDAFSTPAGLWLMEVELPDAAELAAALNAPGGVTILTEATGDPAYSNAELARPVA